MAAAFEGRPSKSADFLRQAQATAARSSGDAKKIMNYLLRNLLSERPDFITEADLEAARNLETEQARLIEIYSRYQRDTVAKNFKRAAAEFAREPNENKLDE